jgi:hypothetical protein
MSCNATALASDRRKCLFNWLQEVLVQVGAMRVSRTERRKQANNQMKKNNCKKGNKDRR